MHWSVAYIYAYMRHFSIAKTRQFTHSPSLSNEGFPQISISLPNFTPPSILYQLTALRTKQFPSRRAISQLSLFRGLRERKARRVVNKAFRVSTSPPAIPVEPLSHFPELEGSFSPFPLLLSEKRSTSGGVGKTRTSLTVIPSSWASRERTLS